MSSRGRLASARVSASWARWPPSMAAVPLVGTASPTHMFIRVVLPAPFGPTSAVRCPAGTASVHSRSAQVWP
jgi:hypothetical protein